MNQSTAQHDPRAEFDRHAARCAKAARDRFGKRTQSSRIYDQDDAQQEALVRLWQTVQAGPIGATTAKSCGKFGACDGCRAVVGRPGRLRYIVTHRTKAVSGDLAYIDRGQERVDAQDEIEVRMRRVPENIGTVAMLHHGLGWRMETAAAVVGRSKSWPSRYLPDAIERMAS